MTNNIENQLKKTFEEFIKTSEDLKASYQNLKKDSELLSSYLSNILNNLDSSILVFDLDNMLKLWNSSAVHLFPSLKELEAPIDIGAIDSDDLDIRPILNTSTPKQEILMNSSCGDSWFNVKSLDFIDKDGLKAGKILMFEDITELKRLQIKSQQEERLKVMGELAAEVAHEIRNPLGSIELMVSLLEEDLDNMGGSKEILGRIRSSVNNMNHTVTNILIYTRELKPSFKEIDFNELLEETCSLIISTLEKKRININKEFQVSKFEADQELLKQAFANIMLNAAEALPEEGTITVENRDTSWGIEIVFKDNGPGIPQQTLPVIFKPFFTTKNTGTGLGLAMTKRVVESHNGTIEASSSDEGACFTIKLNNRNQN